MSIGLSKNWRWKSSLKPVFPCTLKVRSIGQFHPSRERKLSASRMFVLPVSGSPMNRFTRLQEMLRSRIDLNLLIVSFLIIARLYRLGLGLRQFLSAFSTRVRYCRV